MADAGEGSSVAKAESGEEKEIIPGFTDINAFSQQTLRALMLATKNSNDLPSGGDDFDYYSSFPSFRNLMDFEGNKILQLIQSLIRHQGAKGNLSTSSEVSELEDRFDVLVDANDQILERAGTLLDEAAGLRKKESPLVIATLKTPKQPVSGSWNKKTPSASKAHKSSNFRLLAARNIQRPQLKFRDKIDNTDAPFVPKITTKPNAMKSLEDSLKISVEAQANMDSTENSFVYPHPYQYELDHWNPTAQQLEKTDLMVPAPLQDTPFELISKTKELKDLCDVLKKETEFAVDLEHHSYRTFQGITCLMQLSTRTADYIVDTLELRSDLFILNEVFTDPNILKVFHGADHDILWLQRDFGVYVVNMFDTHQAARHLGLAHGSLAYLLELYCQVSANKQYQLADWRIRPLPEELIQYAREDTHHLMYIYDHMKNELLEKGNERKNLLHAVLQRSKEICQKKYEKPALKEKGHLELCLKTKKRFNSQQMAALQAIYSWRDKLARAEDESNGFVLPNHMLLQIAEILPKEAQGVLACCNPVPPLVKQYFNEIHRLVQEAREKPLLKREPIKKPAILPSRLQHPKYYVENLLHCPHDLSQRIKAQDRNSPMEVTAIDQALVATKSSMFQDSSKVQPVESKEQPHISIFGWTTEEKEKKTTKAQCQAATIRASFADPFEKYLPVSMTKPQLVSPSKPTGLKYPRPEYIEWKLKKNTAKRKEASQTPSASATVTVPDTLAQPRLQVEDGEEGMVPLRDQVPVKKKKKKNKDVDFTTTTKELIKAEKKRKKKDAEALGEDETESDFQPHDYSTTDFSVFSGGAESKGRRDYNPEGAAAEHIFKAPAKPKLNPRSGKKSMTYGKHKGTRSNFQWPKR